MAVSVYRHFPSGAWVVAAIVKGYRVQRTYIGYTKRDSVRLFRKEMRGEEV